MANDLIVSTDSQQFMPVMAIQQAAQRRDAIVQFVQGMMRKDTDYGAVPGTGGKPTLLKPGAEKLVTFFGMAPVFVAERVTEDFGDDGREPLFFYRYRCELYRNGVMMGTGIGSCNSRESKYRYRNADRVCPHCSKPTIIKGKAEYGGGWVCFAKKGGCNAKFREGDPAIEGQAVGKVANPDVADLVNTIDKMAQKRALIAAVLIAVNASEFFTQDVEDMITDAEYTVVTQEVRPANKPAAPQAANNSGGSQNVNGNGGGAAVDKRTLTKLHAVGSDLYGDEWDTKRHALAKHISKGRTESSKELTQAEAERIISGMEDRLHERYAAEVPHVADAEPIPA